MRRFISIDRGGGDDDFYGGDATNPVRFDDSDGMDAVHYDDEDETGTLKIYDTYRIVQEGNGSTDVLYSIEKVGFEGFDESNTLDYSNYSSSVDIDSFSFVGRLAEPGDVRTAVRVKETPGGFLGFGAEVFEAINFGYFKLTDYDDKICLKSEGVAEAVTVDAGAGDDEIDVSVTGATIFAGAGEDTIDPPVWRHGDAVKFMSSGQLVIEGRSDTTLNQGGVRIGTQQLYDALMHPDFEGVIEDALAASFKDAQGGDRSYGAVCGFAGSGAG